MQGGSITNSYATGAVSDLSSDSSANVGGLVGDAFSPIILNSYAIGTVSGSGANVGGLMGLFTRDATTRVENSYWLRRPGISGGTNVPTGTSRTRTELISPMAPGATSADTYHSWLNTIWDFGTSEQYPILKDVGVQNNMEMNLISRLLPLCTASLNIP